MEPSSVRQNPRWKLVGTGKIPPDRLLLSGYGSDFTVVIDNEPFHLHRPMLVSRAKYFSDFFRCSALCEERGVGVDLKRHEFPEESPLSADVFAAYVVWWYTGQLPTNMGETLEQRVNWHLWITSTSLFLGTDCLPVRLEKESRIFGDMSIVGDNLFFHKTGASVPTKSVSMEGVLRILYVPQSAIGTLNEAVRDLVGNWTTYKIASFHLTRSKRNHPYDPIEHPTLEVTFTDETMRPLSFFKMFHGYGTELRSIVDLDSMLTEAFWPVVEETLAFHRTTA